MTSAETLLSGDPGTAPRVHAKEADYKSWVYEYIPLQWARWHRMLVYRRFVESFPELSTWFDSPLELRLGFSGGPAWAKGRTTAHEAIGYLAYLSLVNGVALDYEYLLARQFTRLFSRASGGEGLGVEVETFEASVDRLVQLGYAEPTARAHLTWGLTRILLHRGDPDLDGDHRRRCLRVSRSRPRLRSSRRFRHATRGDASARSG